MTWLPLTSESQAETQKLLESIIGLSEATFAHSCFAAQGARHFADPELAPRERKAILSEALGLEIWDRLLELVRADASTIDAELALLTSRLGEWEEDLAAKSELEAGHGDLLLAAGEAEATLARAGDAEIAAHAAHEAALERQREHTRLVLQRDAALAELERWQAQSVQAGQAFQESIVLGTQIAELAVASAGHDALGARLAALEVAEATHAAAARERASLLTSATEHRCRDEQLAAQEEALRRNALGIREQAEALKEHRSGQCDRCGQAIHGDALENTLSGMRADYLTLTSEADAIRVTREQETEKGRAAKEAAAALVVPEPTVPETVAQARLEVQRAREAQLGLASAQERLAGLQRIVAAVESPEFKGALADAEEKWRWAEGVLNDMVEVHAASIASIHDLLDKANEAASLVRACRSLAESAKLNVARSEERLNMLASLAGKAQDALTERTRLTGRLDTLKALERAYGRDGIPALILEATAIPQIETAASEVLEALGTPFRIELVTQKLGKTTDRMRDTLEVVVHEPNGVRRYETYSGGERTRLELALRIGLARMIAHRRGAQVELLALDEPSFLDQAGVSQLVSVLRSLTEFRSVILISHDEALQDAFDNTVTVVRENGCSRLELAA